MIKGPYDFGSVATFSNVFVEDVAVNLAQRFIVNPKRELNFEPWGLGGLNAGRSETALRFVYQF